MTNRIDEPCYTDYIYFDAEYGIEMFDKDGYKAAYNEWREETQAASFEAAKLEAKREADRDRKERSRLAAERRADKRARVAWQRARRTARAYAA